MRRSLVLPVALGLWPATASAATVTLTTAPGDCTAECSKVFAQDTIGDVKTVTITAAPGEANVVTVSYGPGGYRVTDTGALPTPGAGCVAADATSVLCDPPAAGPYVVVAGSTTVRATLGDGDDRFTLTTPVFANVDGGPGADVITTSDAPDTIFDSDDDADVIDGGAGVDTVSYAKRTTGARVDMSAFTRIEAVEGSKLADRIDGSSGPDTIDGAGGADRISGGAGDDTLIGGAGRDVLSGGRGDDRLRSANGRTDVDEIRCGAGDDDVSDVDFTIDPDDIYGNEEEVAAGPDERDRIARDCESTTVDGREYEDTGVYDGVAARAQPLRLGRRSVTLRKPCRCFGSVTVLEAGRRLGSAKVRGSAKDVTVRLKHRPRRTLTVRYVLGDMNRGGWTVRL